MATGAIAVLLSQQPNSFHDLEVMFARSSPIMDSTTVSMRANVLLDSPPLQVHSLSQSEESLLSIVWFM